MICTAYGKNINKQIKIENGTSLEQKEGSTKVGRILESLSLASVMHYVGFRFMQSTMFPFVYSNLYKYLTFLSLIIFGGIRFMFLIVGNLKNMDSNKEKKQWILLLLLSSCLAFPLIYVGWRYNYKFLIFLPIVVITLYHIEAKKVLKWFTVYISILLLSTVICCLSGSVRNLTYLTWYRNGRLVGAYGIVNTTDFASYIIVLCIFYWCIKECNWIRSLLFAIVCGFIVYTTYQTTNSKTALYCGQLLVLAIIWDCFSDNVISKFKKLKKIGRGIDYLSIGAFPIAGMLLVLLCFLYSKDNSWAIKLNIQMGNRVSLCLDQYRQYGIHMIGSLIDSMHGNGATMISNWSSGYGYIDSTYALLAIRYGWIVFLIVMCVWIWMTGKALLSGNRRIALAMAILAIHAFSEARFMDVNYNILLAMPFCNYDIKQRIDFKKHNLNSALSQIEWYKILAGIVIGIPIYVLFPKAMSWLRTIFSLNQWTEGIRSAASLVTVIGICILIFFLWTLLSHFFIKSKKQILAIMFTVMIVFTGGIIVCNNIIQQGLVDKGSQIMQEEETIRIIQSVTKQPVYVAEDSELYQRKLGGFSEHSFSTDELYETKGSIITDIKTEALGILTTGGLYTQLSQERGLYTYDSAVVNALYAKGYRWENFYYSKRSCDLFDLALRNNLKLDSKERLIIHGGNQSITNNLEWDQFAGTYEVYYRIGLDQPGSLKNDDNVCTLVVCGEAGERILLERHIKKQDFVEGICETVLEYHTDDVPKVSYIIIPEPDVTLYLEEITWQRSS